MLATRHDGLPSTPPRVPATRFSSLVRRHQHIANLAVVRLDPDLAVALVVGPHFAASMILSLRPSMTTRMDQAVAGARAMSFAIAIFPLLRLASLTLHGR
jgi:hypothetical protein